MNNYITFQELRFANVNRVSEFGHGDLASGWNEAEWGNAIAGETGELCNLLKKKIRHLDSDPSGEQLNGMIANEMADVVIYIDLLAAKLSINLSEAIKIKFNVTSEKHGFPQRLGRR